MVADKLEWGGCRYIKTSLIFLTNRPIMLIHSFIGFVIIYVDRQIHEINK